MLSSSVAEDPCILPFPKSVMDIQIIEKGSIMLHSGSISANRLLLIVPSTWVEGNKVWTMCKLGKISRSGKHNSCHRGGT